MLSSNNKIKNKKNGQKNDKTKKNRFGNFLKALGKPKNLKFGANMRDWVVNKTKKMFNKKSANSHKNL